MFFFHVVRKGENEDCITPEGGDSWELVLLGASALQGRGPAS